MTKAASRLRRKYAEDEVQPVSVGAKPLMNGYWFDSKIIGDDLEPRNG